MFDVGITSGRPAVRGELDLVTIPALEAWLSQLGELAELDLSGVTFFDSSALRTLLTVRRCHANMRVVNPSQAVVKVLEITGMLDYLVHGKNVDS